MFAVYYAKRDTVSIILFNSHNSPESQVPSEEAEDLPRVVQEMQEPRKAARFVWFQSLFSFSPPSYSHMLLTEKLPFPNCIEASVFLAPHPAANEARCFLFSPMNFPFLGDGWLPFYLDGMEFPFAFQQSY